MRDAFSITIALGGRWHGSYGSVCCPAHEDRNPSLSVTDGDDGRLLAFCHAGCTFDAILDALRSSGLVEGRSRHQSTTRDDVQHIRAAEAAHAAKQARRARLVWEDAATVPVQGTVAEHYLRGRGITCRLPDTLRYQAHGFHPTARRFPMMIGRVDGASTFAIHRTYLRDDGTGKAGVDPRRCMLGATAGGAVRLSDGPGPLVVAEGVETALSLLDGLGEIHPRIWAALSAGGIANLELPECPGRLCIAPDSDDAGQSLRASRALAERAVAAGWHVRIMPAPDGLDWNDVGQETAA